MRAYKPNFVNHSKLIPQKYDKYVLTYNASKDKVSTLASFEIVKNAVLDKMNRDSKRLEDESLDLEKHLFMDLHGYKDGYSYEMDHAFNLESDDNSTRKEIKNFIINAKNSLSRINLDDWISQIKEMVQNYYDEYNLKNELPFYRIERFKINAEEYSIPLEIHYVALNQITISILSSNYPKKLVNWDSLDHNKNSDLDLVIVKVHKDTIYDWYREFRSENTVSDSFYKLVDKIEDHGLELTDYITTDTPENLDRSYRTWLKNELANNK